MRTVLFAVLANVTALAAILFKDMIPPELAGLIGADAVDKILTILASSMLTVTTFSLSVMIAAFSAATNSVSPRATRLLMEDSTTQNALATFVGTFLYSIVSIIALSTGAYGDQGRVILFIVTVGVVVLIVATILIWINHLSSLGRVGETSDRVEDAVFAAVQRQVKYPWLGGNKLASVDDIGADAKPLMTETIGYIQHVDIKKINSFCTANNIEVFVTSLPGAFVHPGRPLLWMSALPKADTLGLCNAFTINDQRSFDQDPRFGLLVLAEIASRALSPAVNDPGTAIEIIGRGMRVLSNWQVTAQENVPSKDEVEYPLVSVLPIQLADLFDDFFTPIARDGASLVEIQIRLQKTFIALAYIGGEFQRQALRHSELALARAKSGLANDFDNKILEQLHHQLQQQPAKID
ncbi:DUF2254 domain-containing protein [Rheinheimera sp. MMS21-TC3]|uniref:DUF2254 domain-containing protein n=1 Tax=Rheinheimera sp. MMS21-TC3 TaxID=3072790 RepID=UPI0028C421B1|nr:DUF2254 domain-containing protein [Rheinheimera sp. MMS21-TC3]WNO61305.1 DUF2254 domain-containing protein [Rheinheimera sp. MMS21-TC3]